MQEIYKLVKITNENITTKSNRVMSTTGANSNGRKTGSFVCLLQRRNKSKANDRCHQRTQTIIQLFDSCLCFCSSDDAVRRQDGSNKTSKKMNSEFPLIKRAFISKTSDKIYYAKIFETHDECTCPGFSFRQTCRHIKELKQKLEERNHPY